MKKRTTIRIITFLSAALIAMSTLAFMSTRKANALELHARAGNERAFDDLVTNVYELSNALEKSVYARDPALESALCTQIFARAMLAQAALSELPYASEKLEQTAGFVAKTGDYAFALSKSVGENRGYSEEDLENLQSLSETAAIMAMNLQDMRMRLAAGELSMDQIYKTMEAAEGEETVPLAGSVFQNIEAEFPEMPTLIYDGPFSEAMSGRSAVFLDGLEEVSAEEGKAIAAAFLAVEKNALTPLGEMGGAVPCYCYSSYINGGEYIVYVTKQGGVVQSVMSSRSVSEEKYSVETALAIADDLVSRLELDGMERSYHMVEDGVLLINYEYTQDTVLCYPDLIKIGIALDNGLLASYDAQGYIQNHTDRELPEVVISRVEAQEAVPESLTVESYQLALIPSEGGEERLCHEFLCRADTEQQYLLYVNAISGREEKILILLEDDNGALTI